MTDPECVRFLQWALPRLGLRWRGFRKVRRQVRKRVQRRMHQLGLADVSDYRSYLESHPGEWPVLDSFCRISISRFYRDRGVFDYLRRHVLPELAERARAADEPGVRCWSAGCASGEEVYTLAILWQMSVEPRVSGVRLEQVATDVDPRLLRRARRARFPSSSLKELPPDWIDAAFTRVGEEYVLRERFRRGIEFREQDVRSQWPAGPFHLVLCRNLVLTYYDERQQREILAEILKRLAPGGIVVTGKQESLPAEPGRLRPLGRNLGVYRLGNEPRRSGRHGG